MDDASYTHRRRAGRGWLMFSVIPASATLVFLAGCHIQKICVTPVDTSASHLVVELGVGWGCKKTPTVSWVKFWSGDYTRELWHFSVMGGAPLSKVTYGEVPKGFSGVEATPLQAGETIRVSISGLGSRGVAVITLTE